MSNITKLETNKMKLGDAIIEFLGELDEETRATAVDHLLLVFTSGDETAFSIPLGTSPCKLVGAIEIAKSYILQDHT